MQIGCQAEQRLIATFFFSDLMALQFQKEIAAAKDRRESVGELARAVLPIVCKRCSEWAFITAGQADQSRREFLHIVQRSGAFRLGGFAHFETRDQLAK